MSHNIPKIEYGNTPTTIEFDYPPVDDDGEMLDVKEHVQTSISGVRQVSIDHIEVVRTLKFKFVSEALKTALTTFFSSHAAYGKQFKYFDDQNSATFVYYELSDFKFKPNRGPSRTANNYLWEIPFKFRRVLGLPGGEDVMATILNNQSSAVDVTGLIFDSSEYTSAIITGELRRKTDSGELIAMMELKVSYNEDTDDWTLQGSGEGDHVDGEPCGVVFSITSSGQVQYTSHSLAGSNYSGSLKTKSSVFSA